MQFEEFCNREEEGTSSTPPEPDGQGAPPEPTPVSRAAEPQKPPVSQRKLEANRQNAQRSTGPKTEEGKAKSSRNSLLHGFFAKKLFSKALSAEERLQYEELGTQLADHYQPIGFAEEFAVEQLFIALVRQGGLIGYEQSILSRGGAFCTVAEKVFRYWATQNRHIAQYTKEIERLQEKRKASALTPPPDPKPMDEVNRPEDAPPPVNCGTNPNGG